ncbi:MAG: RNA 2'-phosphotransferase [Anaerolineaceae bacterium]|nr:RNA 2'-phosphotransferase [Anaerolineaceae bacterium]
MAINLKRVSKYLSFILRHRPETIGLTLDANGWASIDELINKTTQYELTPALIATIVQTNDKQRFSLSADGRKIRAKQGHSITIDLDLVPVEPPEQLFHGTAVRFLTSIQAEGLQKMKRHHVHLSESEAVARNVGSRYGQPVVLTIAARQMYQDGYLFYKTANNVWLVASVPYEYIVVGTGGSH